jgi:hypothetical protein
MAGKNAEVTDTGGGKQGQQWQTWLALHGR